MHSAQFHVNKEINFTLIIVIDRSINIETFCELLQYKNG